MYITITQEVKDALLADAKQIAIYRGYTNLVNGLQPIADLEAKYYHEWQEFREKIAKGASLAERLHEAADLYYYANQLERQTGWSWLPSTLASLHIYSLDVEQVEAAALAKYNWRAEKPGNKDEAFELSLIEQAIQ